MLKITKLLFIAFVGLIISFEAKSQTLQPAASVPECQNCQSPKSNAFYSAKQSSENITSQIQASDEEHPKCKVKGGYNVVFPSDSNGGTLFGGIVSCDDLGRYSIVHPRYVVGGKYYAFPDYKAPKNDNFICKLAGNAKETQHGTYAQQAILTNMPYADESLTVQTNNEGFNIAMVQSIACE